MEAVEHRRVEEVVEEHVQEIVLILDLDRMLLVSVSSCRTDPVLPHSRDYVPLTIYFLASLLDPRY